MYCTIHEARKRDSADTERTSRSRPRDMRQSGKLGARGDGPRRRSPRARCFALGFWCIAALSRLAYHYFPSPYLIHATGLEDNPSVHSVHSRRIATVLQWPDRSLQGPSSPLASFRGSRASARRRRGAMDDRSPRHHLDVSVWCTASRYHHMGRECQRPTVWLRIVGAERE